MQYISPHIILRKGMMDGVRYPLLSEHVADFLARTLFFTSDLYMKNKVKRANVAKYLDNELLFITEQLFFQEPYMEAKNNKWTDTEEINNLVQQLRTDTKLKIIVGDFHRQFQNNSQSLLHADLHSGSIMVTQDSTIVIDPEFAFFGPMGFDIGSYFANIFMSYFGQDGLAPDKSRDGYKEWILEHIQATWDLFRTKFEKLWDQYHEGDLYLYFKNDEYNIRATIHEDYLKRVLSDTIGYTGIEIIRRNVGFAHVADLEDIKDITLKSQCQAKAIRFAIYAIKHHSTATIYDLIKKVPEF